MDSTYAMLLPLDTLPPHRVMGDELHHTRSFGVTRGPFAQVSNLHLCRTQNDRPLPTPPLQSRHTRHVPRDNSVSVCAQRITYLCYVQIYNINIRGRHANNISAKDARSTTRPSRHKNMAPGCLPHDPAVDQSPTRSA